MNSPRSAEAPKADTEAPKDHDGIWTELRVSELPSTSDAVVHECVAVMLDVEKLEAGPSQFGLRHGPLGPQVPAPRTHSAWPVSGPRVGTRSWGVWVSEISFNKND